MISYVVSLVLVAVVIGALYRRVKAWDQEHENVPVQDTDDLHVQGRKAA